MWRDDDCEDVNVLYKPSSHIDLHTHAGSAYDKGVTLTFDLLVSLSVHAERLPGTIGRCLSGLVSIARAVFLLKRGHIDTDKVTDASDHPAHASAIDSVGNSTVQYIAHPQKLLSVQTLRTLIVNTCKLPVYNQV